MLSLGIEASLFGSLAWLGRSPMLWHGSCTLDQVGEPVDGVLSVALLRAKSMGGDDDLALCRHPLASRRAEPGKNRWNDCRTIGRVKT